MPTPQSGSTLLVLEAFEYMHSDKVDTYIELGRAIDDKVEASEPGMLVHALTLVSQHENESVFRWLEVMDSEAALEAHLSNPHVLAHIEKMSQGILTKPTKLTIYCDWENALKEKWFAKLGTENLTFAPLKASFFRST